MKILVLTEGDRKNKGFGHITRCVAVSNALSGARPGISLTFAVDGDEEAASFCRMHGVDMMECPWRSSEERALDLARSSDAVMIDSYLAEKPLYDKISDAVSGRLLMLDDYSRIEYPRGVVVNPAIKVDTSRYPLKEGTLYLFGREYVILRKEFWAVPEKKINAEIKTVFLTLGGGDQSGLIGRISDHLASKFGFKVIAPAVDKKKISAKEMLGLMLEADLCVSGGGQTMYELARVGVPTVAVCLADNQRFNIQGLVEGGFIEYAGWHESPDLLERITGCVEKLRSREARAGRSEKGRLLVNGKGVKNIAEGFLSLIKERPANEK